MTQEATETTQEKLPSPTEAVEAQTTPEGAEEPQPTSAEGQEAAPAEKTPPAWAAVEDPYDVLDLDAFKPILERRSGLTEERLREDYEGRLQTATKNWESTNVHKTIGGIAGNLAEKLEAGDIDGAERILTKLEKFREPYMETHQSDLQAKGASTMANQFLRDMMGELDIRSQEVLFDFVKKTNDWKPVMKKFLELGGQKDYQRGLTENRDAAAEREKVEARKGKGPNLSPGTGAGGTKLYKDLTSEERKVLQENGQVDAYLARERGER